MASEKIHVVSLTGCLVPYRKGKPLVMDVPGSNRPHLPIFSLEADIRSAFEGLYDEVCTIEDGRHFLATLPAEYIVVYNPKKKGKSLHWLEIQRNWGAGG